MIINLRGTKVRTKFVEASLGYRMFDVYVSNGFILSICALYLFRDKRILLNFLFAPEKHEDYIRHERG